MVCVDKTKTDDSSTLVEGIDVPTRRPPRNIMMSFMYRHYVTSFQMSLLSVDLLQEVPRYILICTLHLFVNHNGKYTQYYIVKLGGVCLFEQCRNEFITCYIYFEILNKNYRALRQFFTKKMKTIP